MTKLTYEVGGRSFSTLAEAQTEHEKTHAVIHRVYTPVISASSIDEDLRKRRAEKMGWKGAV